MVPASGELSSIYFEDLKGTSNIKGEILTASNILGKTSTVVSICILKLCCKSICKPLDLIFQSCMKQGKFPIE